MKFSSGLMVLAAVSTARAATASDWRSRSIYQVMTDRYGLTNASTTAICDPAQGLYCGGTWQGIMNNLDYIQNMGFDAVWISPITAQLPQITADLSSYHGYWQQNMYQLNDRFGNVTDLQSLSKALHDRGMVRLLPVISFWLISLWYLMVDIVVNHFAWAGTENSVQFEHLIPFNEASYYHTYCPVTTGDSKILCWLGDSNVELPDLATDTAPVQSIFATWISSLVTQYNIDGLRLDSASNVNADFFPAFCKAAGVFCTAEVYDGNPVTACPYQNYVDSILNYPLYFPLISALSSSTGSMSNLANMITSIKSSCNDTTVMTTFSENHDQPRFPSYTQDMALVHNLLTLTFLSDGIPILYEGQEQHFSGGYNPINREAVWLSSYNTSSPLYIYSTTMNVFRSHVITTTPRYLTYNLYPIYNDTNTLVTRKGFAGQAVITLLNNDGSNGAKRNWTIKAALSGYSPSQMITDVVSCSTMTVDTAGDLTVNITAGMPLVLYPSLLLQNSTVCTNGSTSNPHPVSMNPPVPTSTTKPAAGNAVVASMTAVMLAILGIAITWRV